MPTFHSRFAFSLPPASPRPFAATASARAANAAGVSVSPFLRRLLLASLATTGFAWCAHGQSAAPATDEVVKLDEIIVTDTRDTYASPVATVGGKVAVNLREIPNSVSILTRQQIEDRNLVTIFDALNVVTGVSAIPNETSQSQYSARGYALGAMYDGIPAYGSFSGYQQFDLAILDRVEVWRGPVGLFQGSDNPSGVVNFVRKRPTRDFAATVATTSGSWNNNRAQIDVSGPLNQSKSLRGLVVLSAVDRDFWYDTTHDRKWLAHAALDYDLGAATTVGLSGTIQDDQAPASFYGLPAWADGTFLDVPRSTNTSPAWTRNHWRTEELTADLRHKFSDRWELRLRGTAREQELYWKDAYPTTGVDLTTLTMTYARREYDYHYHRRAFDAFLSGSFDLLARTHHVLLGFNADDFSNDYIGGTAANLTGIRLFHPEDAIETTIVPTKGGESETRQHGFYGQTRLQLLTPLTLVLGGRLSDYASRSHNVAPATPTAWKDGAKADGEFTPYGGLVYDATKRVSLYTSYSDTFIPQTAQTYTGETLKPRVGGQWELGAKANTADAKLNASFAVFRLEDTNRAYEDPDHPTYYLAAGKIRSQGFEGEITGRPAAGLDLTLGYTNLETNYVKDRTNEGKPYNYWFPRHLLKLWAKYRFESGPARNLSLGFGVTAQSRTKGNGTAIVRQQGGYAVLNAQLGYRFSPQLTGTLTVGNLLDRAYYTRIGGLNTYNTYGEPRSFTLALRYSFR